MVFKTGVVV